MRIDAHQHCWRLAERQGAWPPAQLAAIYRDCMPEELAPLLAQHQVRRTVLVQSLPSEADTDFMLGLAERHDFIGAVVGWTDLKHADAAVRIATLAVHPRLRGLRPMLQDYPDPEAWLMDAALAPAIDAMCHHGLSFDALILPHHLPAVLGFAERYPQLKVVIDHAAKPLIAQGISSPWRDDIARLARLPQVFCKLSGLVTEAGPGWSVGQLAGYADVVLGAFGPQRVMWGSDWPVLNLASDYGTWVATCEALLSNLDEQDRQAVLHDTAARFYRLD